MMGIWKVLANNLYMLNHATGCNANYTFMSSTYFLYIYQFYIIQRIRRPWNLGSSVLNKLQNLGPGMMTLNILTYKKIQFPHYQNNGFLG
jgi:hypothetical protein